ncbi:MAG TPA: DUF3592 domain-containing protein [Pyrinomonadaceae bacterium]|nr:DUF3592 domain-containing protein [Pyrinomonadaceae bacterium]
MERIAASAFAWAIGLVLLWTSLRQLRNRSTLNRWPVTKGKVTERGTFKPELASGSPAFRYAPLVKYVYQVDGREFINDRIRPQRIQQPQHNTQKWAEKTAKTFPDEVEVHYNPDDPGESFLFQTPKMFLFAVLGGAGFAILFGIVLFATK